MIPLQPGVLSGALECSTLGHVQMVVGAQVLDQVVLAREAIATLARAMFHGAIAEDGEVHARLMALQVRKASEGLAAVVATKGLSGSDGCILEFSLLVRVERLLTWIAAAGSATPRPSHRRARGRWARRPLRRGGSSCCFRTSCRSCCWRSWGRWWPWEGHRRRGTRARPSTCMERW